RRLAALSMRPTRPAWRTCCDAAGNWSLTPTGGRPRPRTRGAGSWSMRWGCGARATPARGMRPPRARRDARHAGPLDAATLAAEAGRLQAQVDKLVAGRPCYPPNRRLLDHLARERGHLFTFLWAPGVQATNWRAEQAIRPAVVTRKVWGGNRTWAGADTWQVLASVLRTASQQRRDPVELLPRPPIPGP